MNIYSIYKATNLVNGKVYIGFDSLWPSRKNNHHSEYLRNLTPTVIFYRALKKYGWNNFSWEVIYQSCDREHTLKHMENYFIIEYNSYAWLKNSNGYNMTLGGEGPLGIKLTKKQVTARRKQTMAIFKNMTIEQKKQRAINCSCGQKRRYLHSADSIITKIKKSKSHQKKYKIISPDGQVYIANNGLKQFVLDNSARFNITYWQLMNAYRRKLILTTQRKNSNNWVVTKP